jgi:predicted phage tail protein
MSIIEKQYGYIVDLLSCGEIEGVVGGMSGIYLNNTALLPRTKYNNLRGIAGKCTVTGTAVTDANGLFANVDFSDGDRYLQIFGTGDSTTTTNSLTKGATTVEVTAASFFVDKYTKNFTETDGVSSTDFLKHIIRIGGAGIDGADYVGIIIGLNGATGQSASVYPPIEKAVSSGASVTVDEIIKISTSGLTDNGCTLETAVSNNVAQANCRLSGAVQYPSSTTPSVTYDDTYGFVQTGTRYQVPLTALTRGRGAPSASTIIGNGTSLTRSNLPGAGGSQNPVIINGNTFNFSQYSYTEIDAVNIAIEFPGGLRHNGREGESRVAYTEFQIILNYTTDTGGTPTTQSRLIYGKDYGGPNFAASIPSWPVASGTTGDAASTLINYGHNVYQLGGSRRSSGVVGKKSASSSFIKEFTVDLDKYKPFSDWSIEIRRISPEALGEYCPSDNTWIAACNIKNLTAYIYDKFSYPLTAYGAVSFSAEDFQQPPQRAYHLRGMKIKVPTNYFPREEINSVGALYTRQKGTGADIGAYQTWDGTFRGDESLTPGDINASKVYCNNPAWVFYDILTNKEYGLGEYIEESEVDKYTLYQIARYCDELVDNGKGLQEPRFSCNVYLQGREEAYKVLKDLSSVFRGMMYWIDGSITAVQDRPREPAYTFNASNVKNGLFNYSYTGSRSRVNQVNIKWNNPDEFYKQTILTLEDTGDVAKQGKVVPKDIVAFGCTSEGQARRAGQWQISSLLNETEIVTFTTSINASFLRPGDIINIQDKDDIGVESSGRVAAGSTTNVINLDRVISYPGGDPADCLLYLIFAEPGIYLAQDSANINGQPYTRGALLLEDRNGNLISTLEESVNLLDDTLAPVITTYTKNSRVEVKEINGPLSALNQVTVVGAFSSVPNVDTVWAIGRAADTTTDEIREYRILGIAEDNESEFSITASNYYAEKFDEIDVDPPVYTTEYIPLSGRTDDVPQPTDLKIEMFPEVRSSSFSNATGQKVVVSWVSPTEDYTDTEGLTTNIPYRFLSSFEVQHNFTEEEGLSSLKTEKGPGTSNSLSVSSVSQGFYTVRVRTVNDIGVKSPWTTVRRFVSLSPAGSSRINSISVGGIISGDSFSINEETGLVTLGGNKYTFTATSGEQYTFTAPVNTDAKQEAFAALAAGEEAYLYFDASDAAASPPHPWKSIQIYTDNTAQDINGNLLRRDYIVPLGYTGTGLQGSTGTINTTAGSSTVSGTGTLFTTEFSVGDLIKTSSLSNPDLEDTVSEYRTIIAIDSDTSLSVNTPFLRGLVGGFALGQDFRPNTAEDSIIGKVETSAGSPQQFTLEQYINGKGPIGENGQNVGLIASDYSIVYDSTGSNPSYEPGPTDPSTIEIETLSTTVINPEYRYTLNGVAVTTPEYTTNPYYFYPVPATWSQGADVIKVEVRNAGSTIVALSDALSIVRVKQGSGNLTGILTNPNQTINTDFFGKSFDTNFINASGEWEVFFSGDDVTSTASYSVVGGTSGGGNSSKTQNGLTLQINETTGEYDLFQLDPPTNFNIQATVGSGSSTGYSLTPSSTSIAEGVNFTFSVAGAASATVYLQFVHVTTTDADFTATPPLSGSRESIVLNGSGAGTSTTFTSAIDFNTANETFYAEIYDAASGGTLLATSSTITITKQNYNFTVSSNTPSEGDTLTVHLETDNTAVSTLYLSFDSPTGITTADFTNPNFGTNAPIDGVVARTAVTLTAGQQDYTIDIVSDGADSGESFVPAIYGAASGGSSLSSLGTVNIQDTGAASGTAQLAVTSYAFSEEATQAGVTYYCSGTFKFQRGGDLSLTVQGTGNSPDADDWLPIADRAFGVGDDYEIRWEQVSGDAASASFAESTYTVINQTRTISGPVASGDKFDPGSADAVINIRIRKVGAGSDDVDVNLNYSAFVSP